MERHNFPKLHDELLSSPEKENLIRLIGKAGNCRGNNDDKFKYFLSLCRYHCTLPSWDSKDQSFRKLYVNVLLDNELMNTMEDNGTFKWFRLMTDLQAVVVPRDGFSLFHAICTAMWGMKDNNNNLKCLMEKTVPDVIVSLLDRWQKSNHGLKTEEMQATWSRVKLKLEGKSSSSTIKDEEFDSVATFVLANVIQRPIIVLDFSLYASAFHSLGNLNMGGVFLPLDRPPAECCKSPIFLCYRNGHFCPLMFKSNQNQEIFFPLNKGDLSILPVKYIHDVRNTGTVLRRYLNLQEKPVTEVNGSTTLLLCVSVTVSPLPEHLNSVNIHFKKCEEIFDSLHGSKREGDNEKTKVIAPPPSPHYNQLQANPFRYIDESNQTYVVPILKHKDKDLRSLAAPSLISSMNSLHLGASEMSSKGQEMFAQGNTVLRNTHEISELCLQQPGNCSTPGCPNDRHPDYVEICDTCFKKNTIDESGVELISIHDRDKPRYIMIPASKLDDDPGKALKESTTNKTSLANRGDEAHSELTSIPLLSAVNESCKQCSNYYCSQNTYPFCHECCEKNSEKEVEKSTDSNTFAATATAAASKVSSPSRKIAFRDIVYHPPMIVNLSSGSDKTLVAETFCHTKGCHGLRQKNSKLCAPCLTHLKNHSLLHSPTQTPSNNETRQLLEFGQAEILSSTSDQGQIEISEPPLRQNDFQKCASPVCQTVVLASQVLCEKCQDILISHSKELGREGTSEHSTGAKTDCENQQTLSSYRAGTYSGIVGSAPHMRANPGQKVHSEKISSGSALKARSAPKKVPSEMRYEDLRERSAKEKRNKQEISYPSKSNDEITQGYSFQKVSSPSTISRTVDSEFNQMYMRLTDENRKNITQCKSLLCENFGNPKNGGYCNSCFSFMSEEERHGAIFGPTVPDY